MQGLFWLEVWNGVGDELSLKLGGGTCGKRWGLSLRIGAGPWLREVKRDLELENRDGGIGCGRSGCGRKSTGLGVRGSCIHSTNRKKDSEQWQRP